MSQQILFKRGAENFNNRTAAIEKFNTLTWSTGEPVIANYIESGVIRILFAIGVSDGVGSSNYRIISDFETVSQLTTALNNLSTALGTHEGVLATGTGEGAIAGHVINSDESDIEFIDGVGKLKEGSLAIKSLASSAASGIIGYKSNDIAAGGEASASLLTWDNVLNELNTAGLKVFGSIKIGKSSDNLGTAVNLKPSFLGQELVITTDDNFTVSSPETGKLHISLNADLSDVGSELKTLDDKQPIQISGTTAGIITSFNENGVELPGGSTAFTLTPNGAGDNDASALIATVGFVNKKINSVLESNDAMHYMGTFDPTTQTLPAGNAGDTYKISVDGEIADLGSVHVGDMIICNEDNTAEGTASKWDLIEVHNGSLIAPEGAVGGNLVVFGSGNAVSDSGVSLNDLLTKTTTGITAGEGLAGGGNFASGNITISHAEIETVTEGSGDVITGVETNSQGHVTKIIKGNIGNSLTLNKQGNWETDTTSNYTTFNNFVNGVSLADGVLTVFASEMPGTVRVAKGKALGYLSDVIISKDALTLGNNEYAISAAQKDSKIELSVVIDKIDGGTF